jgi:hypothetical protein
MKIELKHPYLSVAYAQGESYGGSQSQQPDRTEQAVGCGVIAALDLLLYLSRFHGAPVSLIRAEALPGEGPLPPEQYKRLAHLLRKAYLPLVPGHGINGVLLALGLDRCFWKDRLPYRAFWGVPYRRLWDEMARMLDQDLPVILAVGPNFPLLWQRHALRLYRGTDEGAAAGAAVHAHYLTVTGMDDAWLRVSSWGQLFYIRRSEFLSYVSAHSARLLSNILVLRRTE